MKQDRTTEHQTLSRKLVKGTDLSKARLQVSTNAVKPQTALAQLPLNAGQGCCLSCMQKF